MAGQMALFYKNLEKYKPYEIEASKRINKLNNVSLIKFCNNFKYDFKTSDKLKYEVKTDEASLKTNNFFIEFSGYGKPTGITTTHANFYILCDTVNYYCIGVNELKELIKENTFKIVKVKENHTFGYLINCQIIISCSISI